MSTPQPIEVTISNYLKCANIVSASLRGLVYQLHLGKKIVDLCKASDKKLLETLAAKAKVADVGICFPTSISFNNMSGNYCPLDDDEAALKKGDLVKIETGVHINGYTVIGAITHYIPRHVYDVDEKSTRILEALKNIESELDKLLVVGTTSSTIAKEVKRIAAEYNCTPVKGSSLDLIQQYNLSAGKSISLDPEQKDQKLTLEKGEVYSVNILLSTGKGKLNSHEVKTTIFKKSSTPYNCKLKASREILEQIHANHKHFPFTLRNLRHVKKARLALTEFDKHGVLEPYPVLFAERDELIGQRRFQIIIAEKPNENHKFVKNISISLKTVVDMEVDYPKNNKRKLEVDDLSDTVLPDVEFPDPKRVKLEEEGNSKKIKEQELKEKKEQEKKEAPKKQSRKMKKQRKNALKK